MAELLSLIAIPVAVLAIVAAWRARAASHRLALEMVHLRDRLLHAEAARGAAEERAESRPASSTSDPELVARVAVLQEQLQRAVALPSAEAGDPDGDLRGSVEKALRGRGFERIVVLEAVGEDEFLVEVVRGGVASKGRAGLRSDGSLRLRSVTSLRAFP